MEAAVTENIALMVFMDIKKEGGDVSFMVSAFMKTENIKLTSTKHPSRILRGCQLHSHLPNNLLLADSVKGISPPFLERGSMTVEAAVVLPLFLFFFLNILSIIEIYSLHSTLLSALRETGNELCVYAYAYDRIFEEEDDEGLEAFTENIAFSYTYVKNRVEELCGEEYLNRAPLMYGKKSLIYADSSVMQQNDCIDLVVSYKAVPLIRLAGYTPEWFYCRFYARAWTGYDVSHSEEEMVYVAEYAKVYHKDPQCSHISLSIREVTRHEAYLAINAYGRRYGVCEKCGDNHADKVYLTEEGEKYHTDPGCSGLKRTIRRIPLSEAEKNYRACVRCAN